MTAEGRLVTYPGAEVVVATDVAGTLTRLLVEERQPVKKGQLLAELKADDIRAEIAEQRAKVAEAEADIRFADSDVERADRLLAAEPLGAPVQVTAEGYDGRSWRGRVEEIPDSVVNRRLKPQDPGRPSDTRVLLVKIALTEGSPLKLGQRVEVEIGRR